MVKACRSCRLPYAVLIGVSISAVTLTFPSISDAQSCGDFYRIQRGDTLREITVKTLGHDRYRVLFEANRDILPSPERLETGQLIFVPCADGDVQDRKSALVKSGRTVTARDNQGDRAAAEADTVDQVNVVTPYAPKFPGKSRVAPQVLDTQSQSPTAKTSLGAESLSILTASGMSPLSDFPLPGGGLVTSLVQQALNAGGLNGEHKVAFVDDRKAHLSVLMPTGAFDLAIPWPGVDCSAENIGAEGRELCSAFIVSRPIYEVSVATIVPQNSPLVSATSPTALRGRRLCRPAGFPPIDIEAIRLSIKVQIERTADACVALVQSGKADGISLPVGASEPDWAGMVVAPGLTRTVPVHALAWRQSPDAEKHIAALNKGLEQLQRSGLWFQIVSSYLRDVKGAQVVTGN